MAERDEARAEGAVAVPVEVQPSGAEEARSKRKKGAQRLERGKLPPDTPLEVIKRKAREERAAQRGLDGVGGSYRLVNGRRVPA